MQAPYRRVLHAALRVVERTRESYLYAKSEGRDGDHQLRYESSSSGGVGSRTVGTLRSSFKHSSQ
jgi:hypothetical protein